MRVVMLTDDSWIDRRILLEAETLSGAGHEVIVLAAPSPDHPSHHFEGSVKVERVGPPPAAPSRRLIQSACNRYVSLSARAAGKLALWDDRLQMRTQPWWRPAAGSLRKASRGGVRALRASLSLHDRASWRAANLLCRLDAKLRDLDDRDLNLFERIRFYRPDVIHAHDLPQLRPAAVAKQALGVPLVYDAHEFYPEIRTLTPRQKRMLAKREARYTPLCDLVITVNAYFARLMAARYRIREPAVIWNAEAAPPGFDERQRYDRFRSVLPIPPDALILLYQGWMALTRGLDQLVRSMALVRNPRVHLVMMGYGEGLQVFRRLTAQLGLSERVHVKDAVPQSELLFWTASADAGIIPYPPVDLNTRYCASNKLYEFIAARLPIVTNDLPFLRDIVAGNGFGVVRRFENPADIAAAVDTMFDHDGAGRERFRMALRAAGDRFAWSVQGEKLLALYRRLTANGQPARLADAAAIPSSPRTQAG